MSNYILLKDRNVCPACRTQAVPKSLPDSCRACGKKLFKATDDFELYEQHTGWREYWIFTSQNGWMHRTQVLERTQALTREVVTEKLPDNYGTPEFIKAKLDNSRSELKEALKRKKKIGVMHK